MYTHIPKEKKKFMNPGSENIRQKIDQNKMLVCFVPRPSMEGKVRITGRNFVQQA